MPHAGVSAPRHTATNPQLPRYARGLTARTQRNRFFHTTDEPLRAYADYINWTPRLGLEILGFA